MSKERKFLDGAFLKEVYRSEESMLVSLGINKAKFIAELQAIPANEKGFFNLTIGPQKNDKKKWSMWIDDYVKGSSDDRKPAPYVPYKQTAPVPAPTTGGTNDIDALPF